MNVQFDARKAPEHIIRHFALSRISFGATQETPRICCKPADYNRAMFLLQWTGLAFFLDAYKVEDDTTIVR